MTQQHNPEKIIYLAEDDEDDRIFFLEAAAELKLPISIVQAADGNELLQAFENAERLPDLFFWISICLAKTVLNALKKSAVPKAV